MVMKLNNKAFAASTILYGMLTISIILLMLILGIMRSNYTLNSKLVSNTETYINSCIAEEIDLNKCKLEKTNCTNDQIAYCNCLSDLKTSPQNCSPYEYVIGDRIEYQGSYWRVIKNSFPSEDYVTVFKETTEGNKTYANINGSSDYHKSTIKKYLEEQYQENDDDEHNLKAVDGYKVRLITRSELMNAGCTDISCINSPHATWIYHSFKEEMNSLDSVEYWTMDSYESGDKSHVLVVDSEGNFNSENISAAIPHYVRPVINLLKSAIE